MFLQRRQLPDGRETFTVFHDFLSEGWSAEVNARALKAMLHEHCGEGVKAKWSTDPAGDAKNPVGPTVLGEYERAGIRNMDRWQKGPGSVADTLALVEALLMSADGSIGLYIHPRCKHTIAALQNYRRKKRGSQWMDEPEDRDAHPQEDIIDALRGGIKIELPEGRRPAPKLRRTSLSRLLH